MVLHDFSDSLDSDVPQTLIIQFPRRRQMYTCNKNNLRQYKLFVFRLDQDATMHTLPTDYWPSQYSELTIALHVCATCIRGCEQNRFRYHPEKLCVVISGRMQHCMLHLSKKRIIGTFHLACSSTNLGAQRQIHNCRAFDTKNQKLSASLIEYGKYTCSVLEWLNLWTNSPCRRVD